VYLYDLKSTGPVEWSQFAHDLRHTSWYAAPLLGRAGIPGLRTDSPAKPPESVQSLNHDPIRSGSNRTGYPCYL
jgi:hypothetical protein